MTWEKSNDVYFWGDSLVAGSDIHGKWNENENLAGQLQKHIPNQVLNRGGSGQTSDEVLIRAGIIQPWVRPVMGKFPAGMNSVIPVEIDGHRLNSIRGHIFACFILGIKGTLRATDGDFGWEFVRRDNGPEIEATEYAPAVVPDPLTPMGTHLFLMGENDKRAELTGHFPETGPNEHTVANYVRAVDAVTANPVKHVLIAGVKNTREGHPGSENAARVQWVNSRLKLLYPHIFVDRTQWLSQKALDSIGVSPTSEDLDYIHAGLVPPSCFSDVLHIRKDIIVAEAKELWAPELKVRGWA